MSSDSANQPPGEQSITQVPTADPSSLPARDETETLRRRLRELESRQVELEREAAEAREALEVVKQQAAGRVEGDACRTAGAELTARQEAEAALAREQERFRFVFENMPVGAALARHYPDGRVERIINDAHLRICGLTREQDRIPGIYREITHPDDRERQTQLYRRLDEGGSGHLSMEKRYVRLDGSLVWVTYFYQRQQNPDGSYDRLSMVVDITEHKQAEQARDRSLSLTLATLESTADGILVVNAEGKIEAFNRVFAQMWRLPDGVAWVGQDQDALKGLLDQVCDPEEVVRKVYHLTAHLQEESFDTLRFRDGRVFERFSRPQFVGGVVVGRVWSFRDVTESRRAVEALRESQAFYHSLVAQLPAGVFRKDREGRYVFVSPAFCRLKGMQEADFLGKRPEEVAASEAAKRDPMQQAVKYAAAGGEHHASIMQGGAPTDLVEEYCDASGRKQYVHAIKIPVLNPEGKVIGSQGILFDITASKRAEEQARHLAAFPELNPNPVLEFNRDGALVYRNPAALAMVRKIGFDTLEQLLPATTKAIVAECLKTSRPRLRLETTHGRNTLSWSFYPIAGQDAVHCYVGDITDRQLLELQLRQAQKMEAIGQLAGGVAHDFNNLLTAIIGHLGLLQENPQVTPEIAESLSEISAAANRATNLTRQLLTFSRRQVMSATTLDLNDVVAHLTKMLRRLLGEDVHVQLDYATEALAFHGDAGLMEQVLVNLAVNARDAMPGGGKLCIATRSERRVPPTADGAAGAGAPATFVRLSVSDTGMGMSAEVRARIFEPFFTTKAVGKGTGLGLATVFGIVQQHHGWIEVETEVGRGTTFHIFLPRLATAPTTQATNRPMPPPRGQGERILLVEDEPSVRDLATMALKRYGYRVLTAASGPQALEVWAEHKADFALLLTDIIMPDGISGLQLARQLAHENPALKVIYTSGYSAEIAGRELSLEDGVNYLAKPYDIERLFRLVRAVLDGGRET